jgi:hypothetical protein
MKLKSTLHLAVALIVFSTGLSATSAEPDLKGIMQGLRDDVVALVDGLLTDNFENVARAAERIASHPTIPAEQVQLVAAELGQEMPTFKQFDTSVHDLSLSIAAAAEAKDRERVIADYQNMLANCLACHAAYKERVATVLAATAQR